MPLLTPSNKSQNAEPKSTIPGASIRKWRQFFYGIFVLLLMMMLAFFWMMETQIGTRVFLNGLQAMSGGQLQIVEPKGKLADQVLVKEVSYRDARMHITLSGVKFNWNSFSLLFNKIELDSIEISSAKIAIAHHKTAPQLPHNLQLPYALTLKNVAIGRLILSELNAGGVESNAWQLSGLVGSFISDDKQHQLQLKCNSEWGSFNVHSNIQTRKPFAVKGEVTYQGQVNADLPVIVMHGSIDGFLQELILHAKTQSVLPHSEIKRNKEPVASVPYGDALLHLSPFDLHPIRLIKLNIVNLDPSQLRATAPIAQLNIQVDLQPDAQSKTGLLGQIHIHNAKSSSIDKNGIPFKTASSQILWSDQEIRLSEINLAMPTGDIRGKAIINFDHGHVSHVDANLQAHDFNMAQVDSSIRATHINGQVQIQTKSDGRVDFQSQLNDEKMHLTTQAYFQFNQARDGGFLKLEKIELSADQSRFSGSAEIDLDGKQVFSARGKMTQFNPADWAKLPVGRIDGNVKLNGHLLSQYAMELEFDQLDGIWSGQALSGVGKVNWQQDVGLYIDNLKVQWGKNSLNAHGSVGKENSELQFQINAQELATVASIFHFPLSGKATLAGSVGGPFGMMHSNLQFESTNLSLQNRLRIAQLNGNMLVGAGKLGAVDIVLNASQIQSVSVNLSAGVEKNLEKRRTLFEKAELSIKGSRAQHRIEMSVQIDHSHRLVAKAAGILDWRVWSEPHWSGMVDFLSLAGFTSSLATDANVKSSVSSSEDLRLLKSMRLDASRSKVEVGEAQFQGALGNLFLDQFEWTTRSISSKGRIDGLHALEMLQLFRPQEFLRGDLRMGVLWDLQLKEAVSGQISLTRQSGDLVVLDSDGTGQAMPLGIRDLKLQLDSGGLIVGTDAERVRASVIAVGKGLGTWQAKLETQLRKQGDQWTFTSEAPIAGELHANVPELQWMAAQINSEFGLKGALNVDATFGGKISKPKYEARIDGHRLELAFASEGLLLPNGELKARMNEETFTLQELKFSNKIAFVPKLEQFQGINWTGEVGEVSASGEVNWRNQTGEIRANWTRFPLLQRKDRWLVMSGQASITQADHTWALLGKLRADAAYFKLPKLPPPSLSSDVFISSGIKMDAEDVDLEPVTKGLKTKLDMQIDMGPRFVFVGRGLQTSLAGTLRLKSNDGESVQASGSIATNGGIYEGYGQQLEIERGILKFQGAPNNPSLNVRALRKGLTVEAGVEVTGTVASPQVRLVSEPNVPDNEKISWLVFGRESDQVGVNDASLLLSAAGAVFSADGTRNLPRELAQGLGFDEISIAPAENGGTSKLPSQTIAGETNVGSVSNDKVVAIGKRIRPGLVLSLERGVSDASGALRLSWQLSRRVRLIVRSGTDNSVDVKYSFSFN